ncbi:MAG TPA: DUF4129 domain-containing protein [Gemmatimonadales bacterium]|nr:DUF4129 domain-containing protein [Gemmatimonadales bacterium]
MPGWFEAVLRFLRAIAHWFSGPMDRLESAGTPLRFLLALLATLILVHAALRLGRKAVAAAGETGPAAGASTRRDEAWVWRRADLLVAKGAYGPAMLAGFHAAMLTLERRGALAYRASATPRELLTRARVDPARRAELDTLLGALYRTAFAAAPISGDEYRAWVDDLRTSVDAPPR